MGRYSAQVADRKSLDDAKLEVEACGGSDFEASEDKLSFTFVADIDDIPAISSMSSVTNVTEVKEGSGDDRGLYVGLKGQT